MRRWGDVGKGEEARPLAAGVPVSALPHHPSTATQVCSESDIDVMRTKAEKKTAKTGAAFGSATHFNKGVSGTWKKKLTVAEGEALSAHCASRLSTMGEVDVSFEA